MNPAGNFSPISARTRAYGLFGCPVKHSLSPAMQNAAFREAGADARYLAFEVSCSRLEGALAGALAMGFGGLNVTVPHKETALALVQEADPLATLVGAANTLVPGPGGWKAHNTDAAGFLAAVRGELGFAAKARRCLLLGAGGAARAAAVALGQEGAQEIFVANRNEERATALCADLAARVPGIRIHSVALNAAREVLEAGDLLVSATPLGLEPGGQWPWDLRQFHPGVLVYDMAYVPAGETLLTLQARRAGLVAASGRSMLLAQGGLAFSLWTGLPAPLDAMGRALGEAAQKVTCG